MNYQVNLLCRQDNENCLDIVVRGLLDRQAFLGLMQAIGKLAEPLSGCKVLLDLQDITCDLGFENLVELKAELRNFPATAAGKVKLAMVTTPHPEQYHGLRQLTLPVSQLGIDVEAFCESRRAIEWLAEESDQRFSQKRFAHRADA
jgi:hypothetical protein